MTRALLGRRRPWFATRPGVVWLATLLVVTSLGKLAPAQDVDERDRNAARHLALEGAELFDSGQYELAADRFSRAHSLFPAPTLASWHARCLERQGRWLAAEERYIVAANWKLESDAAVAYREAVRTAQRELNELRSRIPEVRIVVGGASDRQYVLRLDGREVPAALVAIHQPVDPGAHTIEAWVEEELIAKVEADVSPLERRNVIINIPPEQQMGVPSLPSSSERASETGMQDGAGEDSARSMGNWQMPVAIAGFSVGAVGVGLGVWQGFSATAKHSDLDDDCGGGGCMQSELDEFRSARDLSTVGYIIGGVGIATGAVTLLLFNDPGPGPADSAGNAKLQSWIGLGSAGVRGSF